MRVLASTLSVIGLVLLLLFVDLRWGFVRLPFVGFEAVLVGAGFSFIVGLAVSVTAAVLAFLDLRRATTAVTSRRLFAWCFVLVVGFAVAYVL